MDKDRKALLESLRIEREEAAPGADMTGSGRKARSALLMLMALTLFVGGLAVGHYLWPPSPSGNPAAKGPAAASSTPQRQTSTTVAPAEPDSSAPSPSSGQSSPAIILNASGYVVPRVKATVSSEITGRLTEVLVEEGQRVTGGEVVARLDDTLAMTALRLAEARLAAARARIAALSAQREEATRELTRKRTLAERGYASKADVTRAEAELGRLKASENAATADAEAARRQLDDARERLAKHVIRAPFAGIVVAKNAQPGEIVSPVSAGGGFTRTGICTIVDMSSLEIEVDVAEAHIARIQPGQRAEARLDAYPDWPIPAHVVAVIPTADRAKATVRVRLALDERDARILPDMGVNVAFFPTGG
ncbi:MAG: efflux RND transporter periplasmic adaptor subunit [Alphaproteobacteria bacterium]|nr:MAG: efflux RND transporter periplasmic adaptor subunit [Alphaproteobacteria bacterium]